MGRKSKKRHKGRSAQKRVAQIVANSAIQWVRIERSNIKQYRLEKISAWRKVYHSHEKRAFTTAMPNKGRAMVKCGPVVYHVTALVEDKWETKHFSTRSIKSARIKGLHSPTSAITTVGGGVKKLSKRIVRVGEIFRFYGFNESELVAIGLNPQTDFSWYGGYFIVLADTFSASEISSYQSILSQYQF